jgi:SAM-dependent methyltransferase
LNPKERRQVEYKIKYKKENPKWDETLVFLARELSKLGEDDLVVLDVGCGNGNYVVDENRKKIAWAAGVDLDESYVKKNICLDEIKIADLESLPFDDSTFDVVLSLWVLEHLKNPGKAFEEVYRVLKPGGLFMFATPNKKFLPLVLMNFLKSNKINHLLNKLLFGREPKDVFPSYYGANDLKVLEELSADKFKQVVLRYNYDPGYTSFNDLTYRVSNISHSIFTNVELKCTYPHIVGVLKKVQ